MNLEKVVSFLKDILQKKGPAQDLKEFLALSAKNPEDMRYKLKVGELYFKQKDLENGVAVFSEVAERYTQEGFLLKAIAIYKNVIKYVPGSVLFNEKLGDLYRQLGMDQEATEQYQIAIHYHLSHGQVDQATLVGQKLVEVSPEDIQPRLKLAELYHNQGKENESLLQYEKVATKLRKDMTHLDVLVDVLEKILLKKPQELGMLQDLCVFYLKLGEVQKVIGRIEKNKLEDSEQFRPIYQKALELKHKTFQKPTKDARKI